MSASLQDIPMSDVMSASRDCFPRPEGTTGVTVIYSVTLDNKRYFSEMELADASPELLTKLEAATTLTGCLCISSSNSTSKIEIFDELAPWIQNLCFHAVSKLNADTEILVSFFTYYEQLVIREVNDLEVKLHLERGDDGSINVFSKAALKYSLYHCGKRFVELIGKIKRNDESYMANLEEYVTEHAAAAKEAVYGSQQLLHAT